MKRQKTARPGKGTRFLIQAFCFLPLLSCCLPLVSVSAEPLPSLFRGVVVADSPFGIRVVSVEESSQAFMTDLRPEDVIIEINQAPIRTIEEFAAMSQALKGTAAQARIVVLRNGQPRELTVHLYSVAVLRQWDLAFLPEHDIRFAEAKAGVAYWVRMGRGFEEAGNLEDALNAYLNALHNDPAQLDVAVKACCLLWRIAQRRLEARKIPEAVAEIQQGTRMLSRLFEQPLDEVHLKVINDQLQDTLEALREVTKKSP